MQLKELLGRNFVQGIRGIATSAISFDNNNSFTGYIYATQGEGNMESYLSINELINEYPELEDIEVFVEFDIQMNIRYLYG